MLLITARTRPALAALFTALLVSAVPLKAQTAPTDSEARLRKVEAEVRALQRQVFPGSDGKFFTPQVGAPATVTPVTGAPATTPVTDLLTRMDSVEAQIARLTAQSEETANRVAQLEAKLAAPVTPPPVAAAPSGTADPAPATALVPAPVAAAPVAPAGTAAAELSSAKPSAAPAGAKSAATAKPAKSGPAASAKSASAKPAPERVAAVAKIAKPDTGNAADDEYSYGYRLWEAKFYPEAAQQLRLYVDKYPRDAKISFGRNLLGRAYLDDGKPRDAAPWFLKNYQADKKGARAADSLLYLAESMRQLDDTNRACIALAEFSDTYPGEAAGRLKSVYDATRKSVKCDN